MKNFARALKFALRYRGRLVISLACALVAAALWGVSFAAVYPVLQLLGPKNLQQLLEAKTGDVNEEIDRLEKQIDELTRQKKAAEGWPDDQARSTREREISDKQASLENQLAGARSRLWRYQQANHHVIRHLPQDRFQTLALLLAVFVVSIAIKGVFEFGQEYLVGIVTARSVLDIRTKFFRATVHQDLRQIQEGGSAELMSRFTNDMETIGSGMKILFGRVVGEPLRAIACLCIAMWISWQLTLVFVLLVPSAILVMTAASKRMKRASRRVLERMGSLYKILQETFQGLRIVKAFTMEPYERRRFHDAAKDYANKSIKMVRIDAMSGPMVEFAGMVAVSAALLAGAYLVLSGEKRILGVKLTSQPMESAMLITLYAQLIGMADPIRKLSSVYTKLQGAAAACDRVFFSMDRTPEVQANPDGPRLGRHSKEIEFQNVCFSYLPERQILTNICLTVKATETVAIVGANGSGKSTLLNLLPRFYDPDHGTILIDGLDIRKVNLRSLRRQIALVSQDPILFDDTIYNNIRYGTRGATKEQVEEAATKAFAHDFIMVKGGYETKLGDLGSSLSGGEKQRIALARAILRDPSILILDEFSSAIDPVSDRLIHDALQDFKKGRTTFFITHKMHTVQMADRIVVLDNHGIAGLGTHKELMATSPIFRGLYDAQIHSQAVMPDLLVNGEAKTIVPSESTPRVG
jgi:ATP-binding cassette subfamily B protein/subfamily B ATP-binding cassette protein MsbA